MILKIKKVNKEAIIPKYAHKGDAGLDLYSVEDKFLCSGDRCIIKTGIIIELPQGTEAQIRPRSGLAIKHGITLLNTPGTIDEGYRGEIGIIIINHSRDDFMITKGMRIAQMVIQKVLTVDIVEEDELTISMRGENGFGSSGV